VCVVRSPGGSRDVGSWGVSGATCQILHRREGQGNGGGMRCHAGADRQVRSDATAVPDASAPGRPAPGFSPHAEVCCAAHQGKKRHNR